jgi:hypothetical protein
MGTNYTISESVCPHCGRGSPERHIGKSSAGWVFALHVYPEEGIQTLEDWIPLLFREGAVIKDEYENQLTPHEMLCVIMARCQRPRTEEQKASWEKAFGGDPRFPRQDSPEWYAQNGPSQGLLVWLGPGSTATVS